MPCNFTNVSAKSIRCTREIRAHGRECEEGGDGEDEHLLDDLLVVPEKTCDAEPEECVCHDP